MGLKDPIAQPFALTPAQKGAIYNVVERQRPRAPGIAIPLAVGASVARADELSELPEAAAAIAGQNDGAILKYAMVEGNLVVIDPLSKRVVEVIRGGPRP